MKIRETLTLITINGYTNEENIRLHKVKDTSLYPQYNFKKIRNFLAFELKTLGINVAAYNRGNFKITIKQSKFLNNVIQNINEVINMIVDILELIYGQTLPKTTVRITQLATVVKYSFNVSRDYKLSYQSLIGQKSLQKNSLTFFWKGYKFVHTINWFAFENGTSSYYFRIYHQEEVKACGGLKLYNNLKIVLFSFIGRRLATKIIISFVKSLI